MSNSASQFRAGQRNSRSAKPFSGTPSVPIDGPEGSAIAKSAAVDPVDQVVRRGRLELLDVVSGELVGYFKRQRWHGYPTRLWTAVPPPARNRAEQLGRAGRAA